MSKVLYRYEIVYKNEDGDTSIRLREFPVIRETEKCYFINWGWHPTFVNEKRVSKDAHNTYAYDTKEDAKDHFMRRTRKRIAWFEFWIEECKKGLELIEQEATDE